MIPAKSKVVYKYFKVVKVVNNELAEDLYISENILEVLQYLRSWVSENPEDVVIEPIYSIKRT